MVDKMSIKKTAMILEDPKISVKIKLSALWVTVMFLYIYADYLSLFRPGMLEDLIAGDIGVFQINQTFLLVVSIMMSIPSVMVFLSLILKPKVNRGTNIIVGIIFILIAISGLIGESWIYYFYFSIVEIVLLSMIVWFSWKWPKQEARTIGV